MNADTFNALYAVGAPVFAYPGCRPEHSRDARRIVTRTRTEAKSVGLDRDGVVWVEDHGAYIALTHVDVVPEDEWKAAKLAEAVASEGALPMPAAPVALSETAFDEYAYFDFTSLMSADAAAVVSRMRDLLINEIHRLRAGPSWVVETSREWAARNSGGTVIRHRSLESAMETVAGSRKDGEPSQLVCRDVGYGPWTEAGL